MIISFVLIPLWSLIAVFPYAMIMYAFYFIAKRYSNNEVLHTVIAIVTLGMAIPIQLFRFRNRELIMAY
ncbi:hypothetical protein D7X33_46360 [Butyricicoccus sp. 1XD8-22]|nr:hypothetical protein D7X33_46360 [Butyricicoccus sp. 1XD8-22]